MRVRDWTGMLPSLLFIFVALVALIVFAAQKEVNWLVLIPLVLLICGIVELYFKFNGAYFNPDQGTLRFPGVFGSTVKLEECDNANCEMTTRIGMVSLVSVLLGKSVESKLYCVNISGAFGSKVAAFGSKRGRDHFLSALQKYAPNCSISRHY